MRPPMRRGACVSLSGDGSCRCRPTGPPSRAAVPGGAVVHQPGANSVGWKNGVGLDNSLRSEGTRSQMIWIRPADVQLVVRGRRTDAAAPPMRATFTGAVGELRLFGDLFPNGGMLGDHGRGRHQPIDVRREGRAAFASVGAYFKMRRSGGRRKEEGDDACLAQWPVNAASTMIVSQMSTTT